MPTPSETLGEQIVARLIEEGLLSADQAEQILPKLVDGSLKQDDWRLAVEMSDRNGEGDDE